MTISIWRYSHLTLAISSFIFILTASITGIILAFEPISNQLKPYAIPTDQISLSQTISSLKKEYQEIITLKVTQNNFVSASVITKKGKNKRFYINPISGKKISNIIPKSKIYKWATNLHRSLFLKSTGRFLVGLFSFLLLLITITGSILIIKRQGGIKRFFSKVVKENFAQYYHVVIGRFALIPIIIITVTGVYLSFEKFNILPNTKIKHTFNSSSFTGFPSDKKSVKKIPIEDFATFKKIKLSELKSIEFPFSDDNEDYFLLKLHSKELIIHQYSGEIISAKNISLTAILVDWSLFLHTGRGTIFWAIILLLTAISILFFSYSGFAIALKRKQKSLLPKNTIKKDIAEIIILVGSETGESFRNATSLYNALIISKKSVFIAHLNDYTSYKKAQHLLLLTSTYAEGKAPVNATNFLNLLQKITPENNIKYAVIGFGSLAYKDYCKFAIDIDNALEKHPKFEKITALYKINNQDFLAFKKWELEWCQKTGIDLQLKLNIQKHKKQQQFSVVSKTLLNNDACFLIRLKPIKKIKFTSGDLMAIIPKKDGVKRLYSVGKIENDVLLSVKKHEFGVCSNLLFNLEKNTILKAKIEKNKAFQYPKKSKKVILIANGTGIAPFLGMLNNSGETHLFWGGRTQESLKIYLPFLSDLNPKNIHISYSQEKNKIAKQYVQDSIFNEPDLIADTLKNNGSILICGSVAMMNGVLKVLAQIALQKLNTPIDKFNATYKRQIKTDCY
ncbi:PepSY domain-containing protein [Tenacibaculum finnmarkense]|uniref:PepSY domain-containing protein n=1 Tax=Tenacibaculum finnmarkense TaxID=2781243 RepID=UPI0023016B68|nr:PepSY domain-containing protein [Tenacibaculum finnmarkense]WCC45329.1 PepSY domain-containing protein [Tenacibaculum finnmarkense]WCC47678.1 PepSY domain-containing protein [Tenacibaculum finnmarkense]